MINRITQMHLRNTEHSQFFSDVLGLIQRQDPSVLKVEEAYNLLKSEHDQLVELLNPEKGSQLTEQIEEADDLRDELLVGIYKIVDGTTAHYNPTQRAHAETLLRSLDLFGGMGLARENYQSETAGISSMLSDWDSKTELTEAVAALKLKGWQNALTLANEQFNDLYLSRTEETSDINPVGVRELRLKMKDDFYDLRDLITAYYTIHKGAEPYATTIKQLNTLIDQYKQLLKSRKSKVKELIEIED
ncbi:DUF6261 family protein [Reichenbachiella ulvae]|uniref:DUF6261 family protein n=1 Tax=Reichenbachiella ulvae TaxID=2980104 RepID=A0ABT3CNF9_9BACT|nr:DUF6261 family protein [Reichenbachiella ulvae]MCV9385069.1 DUF6261 family protein [Reichenbachiella ulvae]